MKKKEFQHIFKVNNSVAIRQPEYIRLAKSQSTKWVPFGKTNCFPAEIAFLNRTSPVHGGILNSKVNYVNGAGLNVADENLKKQLLKINNKSESLHDISRNYFNSLFSIGNAYIHIITNKQRNFFSLFILDYTTVRIGTGECENKVLIHPDFKNTFAEAPKEIALFPYWTENANGFIESVYMVNNLKDGYKPYGLPDWLSALDSAETNKAVNNGNKNRSKSGVWEDVVISAQFNSLEEAEKYEQKFKEKKQGDENAGEVLFLAQGIGAANPTVNTLQTAKDGFFQQLHALTVDNLIIAHNWFRSLSSLADNTGFDTQRILNEYMIARNTIIATNQQSFSDIINEIYFAIFNIDISGLYTFINKPPVIEKSAYRVWEYRKEIGIYQEGDENVPEFQALMGSTNKTTA